LLGGGHASRSRTRRRWGAATVAVHLEDEWSKSVYFVIDFLCVSLIAHPLAVPTSGGRATARRKATSKVTGKAEGKATATNASTKRGTATLAPFKLHSPSRLVEAIIRPTRTEAAWTLLCESNGAGNGGATREPRMQLRVGGLGRPGCPRSPRVGGSVGWQVGGAVGRWGGGAVGPWGGGVVGYLALCSGATMDKRHVRGRAEGSPALQ
jgi:hypothetical protein